MKRLWQIAAILFLIYSPPVLAAIPVLSGVVDLRIDSGDVSGDPAAFQFTVNGNPIGVKLERPGPKPWVYSMKWDSRTVPDGLYVLAGLVWDAKGATHPTHQKTIRVRQPIGKMASR